MPQNNITQQANDWRRRAGQAIRDFDKKDRKRILRRAARPVVDAARSTAAFSDSKKPHKYTRKDGSERIIRPGNLRRSLDRIPRLSRDTAVSVGPRFGGRARKNADGFYAQWLYGKRRKKAGNSAAQARRIFYNRVLAPAARQGSGSAFRIIINQARKNIVDRGKKYGVA